MIEKTCGNCWWWDPLKRTDYAMAEGFCCVKLPPHIERGGATNSSKTVKDYYCALFSPCATNPNPAAPGLNKTEDLPMQSVRAADNLADTVAKVPEARVSLVDIEANVAFEFSLLAIDAAPPGVKPRHVTKALETLTLHVVVLRNGFTLIGKSAPADAANFNASVGKTFAREDAIRQCWPLMGYALRERLAPHVSDCSPGA